jgi:hypothetical protein
MVLRQRRGPRARGQAPLAVRLVPLILVLATAAAAAALPPRTMTWLLYLGVVMAHFVIDAGLWRLRDSFPRRFLASRMPYLLRTPMDR